MARYKIPKDGHPYLIHGYPVLDKRGHDDVRFSRYRVNPGAERLFEQAGFEDSDKVSGKPSMRYFSTGISITMLGLMELRFHRSQIKS